MRNLGDVLNGGDLERTLTQLDTTIQGTGTLATKMGVRFTHNVGGYK